MTAPLAADRRAVLDRLRAILLAALGPGALESPRATIFLFGSWAAGAPGRASDIDIAVDADGPLPPGWLARLRERLEESTIPYRVDVVDLADTDPEFRARVRRDGVAWIVSGSA